MHRKTGEYLPILTLSFILSVCPAQALELAGDWTDDPDGRVLRFETKDGRNYRGYFTRVSRYWSECCINADETWFKLMRQGETDVFKGEYIARFYYDAGKPKVEWKPIEIRLESANEWSSAPKYGLKNWSRVGLTPPLHQGAIQDGERTPGAGAANKAETNDIQTLKVEEPGEDPAAWESVAFIQGSLVNMLVKFTDARVQTEHLLMSGSKGTPPAKWSEAYKQALVKWQETENAIGLFKEVAESFAERRLSLYREAGAPMVVPAAGASFFSATHATFPALAPEEILAVFDRAPSGQKLAAVADALGADMHLALATLDDINKGVYQQALKEEEKYKHYENAARVVESGSKVLLTIGGVAASGGTLALSGGPVAAANMGIVAVGGAEAVLDVCETTVNIGVQDPQKRQTWTLAFQKAKAPLSAINFIFAVKDVGKAIKGFAYIKGQKDLYLSATRKGKGKDALVEYKKAISAYKADYANNMMVFHDVGQKIGATAKTLFIDPSNNKISHKPPSAQWELFLVEARKQTGIDLRKLLPDRELKILEAAFKNSDPLLLKKAEFGGEPADAPLTDQDRFCRQKNPDCASKEFTTCYMSECCGWDDKTGCHNRWK